MPIVYQRPDGGISVCIPCVSQDDPPHFTMDHAHDRAMSKDIPEDATNVFKIANGILPENDDFRDAWIAVDDKGNVTYDAAKAKDIVNQALIAEIKTLMSEHDLTDRMGRDTSEIQAKITDCQSRIAKLDAFFVSGNANAETLTTLKELIKSKN